MRWTLTNNIIAALGSNYEQAIELGASPSEFTLSQNNLVYGFLNNAASPTPTLSTNDDMTAAWTAADVFINAAGGDFRVLAGGPADGTGLNVHSKPTFGGVTRDLLQLPRPATGAWERGALKK